MGRNLARGVLYWEEVRVAMMFKLVGSSQLVRLVGDDAMCGV